MVRYVICRLASDNTEEYYRVNARVFSETVWDDAIWFTKPSQGIVESLGDDCYVRKLYLQLGGIQ